MVTHHFTTTKKTLNKATENTPTALNTGNKNTQTNDRLFMKQIAILFTITISHHSSNVLPNTAGCLALFVTNFLEGQIVPENSLDIDGSLHIC